MTRDRGILFYGILAMAVVALLVLPCWSQWGASSAGRGGQSCPPETCPTGQCPTQPVPWQPQQPQAAQQPTYSATPLSQYQRAAAPGDPTWVYLPVRRALSSNWTLDPVDYNGRDFGGPHETTHEINSKLRNAAGGSGWNACYVLGGRAALVHEPPVRLSAFAATVPMQDRGGGYSLYLVDQLRYWDDHPCYILDELSAYANGFQIYQATNNINASISLARYREFLRYADLLSDFCATNARGYDRTQFNAIVNYQRRRLTWLTGATPAAETPSPKPCKPAQPTIPSLPLPPVPVPLDPCRDIRDQLAKLQVEIETLKTRAPIPGPVGPAGKDGANGKDATATIVNLAAIDARLTAVEAATKLPLWIGTRKPDGSIWQEATPAMLGQTVWIEAFVIDKTPGPAISGGADPANQAPRK